jgi:hypothetical protein
VSHTLLIRGKLLRCAECEERWPCRGKVLYWRNRAEELQKKYGTIEGEDVVADEAYFERLMGTRRSPDQHSPDRGTLTRRDDTGSFPGEARDGVSDGANSPPSLVRGPVRQPAEVGMDIPQLT